MKSRLVSLRFLVFQKTAFLFETFRKRGFDMAVEDSKCTFRIKVIVVKFSGLKNLQFYFFTNRNERISSTEQLCCPQQILKFNLAVSVPSGHSTTGSKYFVLNISVRKIVSQVPVEFVDCRIHLYLYVFFCVRSIKCKQNVLNLL